MDNRWAVGGYLSPKIAWFRVRSEGRPITTARSAKPPSGEPHPHDRARGGGGVSLFIVTDAVELKGPFLFSFRRNNPSRGGRETMQMSGRMWLTVMCGHSHALCERVLPHTK